MMLWKSRLSSAAALGVAMATLQIGAAPAADAAEFDVWFSVDDVRISSGACRDIPFTVNHDGGLLTRFAVEAEVWRGSRYLSSTFDYHYDTAAPLRAEFFYCPSAESLGKHRLGPASVEWAADGEPYWSSLWEDWETDSEEGSFTDSSRASFVIKQDHRATITAAAKKKGRLTVTAKLRYYDTADSRWRNDPRGRKVTLQRKTVSGWKKIGVAKVGAKGRVTVSGKAAKGRTTYRVLQNGSAATWSAVKTVRR